MVLHSNYFISKSNEFDFMSLMGTEKVKLLDDLPNKLNDCQPEKICSLVQKIWKVYTKTFYLNTHTYLFTNRNFLSCTKY